MSELLRDNPLVLMFTVAAVGYMVGKVSFKGVSLNVAAVLFVGLAFGAFIPDANVPDILFQLGLILFVYSVGISSGNAFFSSIRANGGRDIIFGIVMLTISAVLGVAIYHLFGLDASTTTGIYAGSTTNTPALGAIIEQISQSPKIIDKNSTIQKAVVAYSFTYPMGVISSIIAILLLEKFLKIDYDKEKHSLKSKYPVANDLTSITLKITNPAFTNIPLRDILKENNWNIIFAQLKPQNQDIALSHWETKFNVGDQVMVVGSKSDLQLIVPKIGEKIKDGFHMDRSEYDVRRIFVSNPNIAGKTISELNLNQKYHAVVTRIRRGDVDMLATGNTVLELGDRVRFVARRKDLKELSKFFGDSYYAVSHLNLFSFGLGIALGLLLGTIEFTLPGGIQFKLGLAGGPIIVSLILGALQRTGPVVWNLPYSVNITLRQIGLILLLANIGLKSGPAFFTSLAEGGLSVFLGGVVISLMTALLTIIIGYKLVKIPFTFLTGIVSNQPAILEFALGRAKNNLPIIGYTMIFPISLILKIVYAQILFMFLS